MSRRLVNGAPAPGPLSALAKAAVFGIACLLVLLPFVMVISTSLADTQQLVRTGAYVLWPERPTLQAYQAILGGGIVPRALAVSIFITIVGTVISMAVVTMFAYALSRPGSLGSHPLLMMVLFSMLFTAGMIPNYLLMKNLGLLDSLWSLILPYAINGFQVIIVRGFFLEIPSELTEAATVDGANDLRILLSIVLPLSKAPLAVIGLFNAVSFWNAYFNAVLYINSPQNWPLQVILRTYVVDSTSISSDLPAGAVPPQQSLQMAILVIALVPIAVLYPFLQKHFAKGLMIGAVKG